MIQVLKINKHGNRISSYTCTDGSKTLDLTKEQLINFIDRKMVNNAKKQVYQGKTIIRVDDAAKFISNHVQNNIKEDSNNTKSNNTKYEENQLIQYVNKAKEKGIKELDLGQIVVDTSTFEIRKIDRLSENEIEANAILKYLEYTYGIEEAFKLYSKYVNRNVQPTNSNIKPDSNIKINKDTPWLKEYIKFADKLYQEIINNKSINKLLNTKYIESYLYIESDIEEFFIHTTDKTVHRINELTEEEIYVNEKGKVDIFIGIAYRDPNKKRSFCLSEEEKRDGFYLYLDYNVLTNQFSLSSNDDYEILLIPDESEIWLNANEALNFLKFNLSKLR